MKSIPTLFALLLAAVFSSIASAADEVVTYFGTYTRGESKGIYSSLLNLKTGALSKPELAAEVENPSFLALHPRRPFLYAVSEVGGDPGKAKALCAFRVIPRDRSLKLLSRQSTGGDATCHLSITPDESAILVANYMGGSVSSILTVKNGGVGEVASFHQHEGSSINPKRQNAPHAHSINPSPDGKFALAADLGLDKILIYKLDHGKLIPNDPPFAKTPEGGGPRHLSFHPSGNFVFANDEIHSTVTAYAFNPKSGALSRIETESTLPDDFEGNNSTAECLVHPNGKFLYVSNRGHNSIAVFSIDQKSGALDRIEIEPAGGAVPRGFGIDPTGQFLIAAHQQSNSAAVLKIDSKSGALEPTGHTVDVPSPVCVRFFSPPSD